MKKRTKEFVDALSNAEVSDVVNGVVRQHQREASDMAWVVGDLLATELRVMGLTAEAAQVDQIVKKVRPSSHWNRRAFKVSW